MSEKEKDKRAEADWNAFSFGNAGRQDIPSPPGYFEQFPDRIMDRWATERATPLKKRIPLSRMIAAAAIVSGICFGVAWWTNHSNTTQATTDISGAEAYQYILEHIDEFAPLINQPDQWAEQSSIDISPSDAIEEYLIEELEGEDIEIIF
jgi:hypothetical protein